MNHIDVMKQAVTVLDAGVKISPNSELHHLFRAAIAAAEKVEPWGWALPADRDYTIRQVSRIEPSPSGIATPLYTTSPAAIPPGWQLVPVEPTREMVETYLDNNAAYWAEQDKLPSPLGKWRSGTTKEATKVGYKSMLAAAPKPPQTADVVRDAERYRWLRDRSGKDVRSLLGVGDFTTLNAAIDEAMKQ